MNRVELSERRRVGLQGTGQKFIRALERLGWSPFSSRGWKGRYSILFGSNWIVDVDNAIGGLTCKQIAVASSRKSGDVEENVRVTGNNPAQPGGVEHP